MKTVVILYADDISKHLFEPVFGGKSACSMSLEWAKSVPDICSIVLFTGTKNAENCEKALKEAESTVPFTVKTRSEWTVPVLISDIADTAAESAADFILYAWADCPFLDTALTREIIKTHRDFRAEYTCSEGYPYGFSPEAIDSGAAEILARLAEKRLPDERVGRDAIFSVIRKDINSFEVETVLASEDWRQLRLQFECGSKSGRTACTALYQTGITGKTAADLSNTASIMPEILKTVPAFYNIQIQASCPGKCIYCPYPKFFKEKYGTSPQDAHQFMDFEKFKTLIAKIKDFSETAVVSLSAWGEALQNSLFAEYVKTVAEYSGLSVLVETTAQSISEETTADLADYIKKIDDKDFPYQKIMWIVSLDAADSAKYALMHGLETAETEKAFATAVNAVELLEKYFPGAVYPQFVRTNKNEDQLEKFFRYWDDKKSPSQGSVIIQKYNDFAGLLPPDKPADLAPLVRNPCWHIRRDMTILCNGDVPFCTADMLEGTAGNVFRESLETVWQRFTPLVEKHIKKDFPEKCRRCDEYYTFIF